ncbi:MAG TPA: hypothetical protein PKY77_05850 [Phycisphaerae bacterium]|nr:hypothetical protein [Phycisphaerae bacterium]HRY69032.1 hypothetical protein [Phycisphaerae bacterium]HSA25993.1 hypothetical protein [Phycisphaerae bacterium]
MYDLITDIVTGQADNGKIVNVMLEADNAAVLGERVSSPKTGLTYADVTFCWVREGAADSLAHGSCVTMTADEHVDGGFVEIDSVNAPGLYQFGVPDAALVSGANSVIIVLQAAGVVTKTIRLLITTSDFRAGGGGGFGGTVVLGPVVGGQSPANQLGEPLILECHRGEAKVFTLTVLDADDLPIDLSGKTLAVVFAENQDDATAELFELGSSYLTVTGDDDNVLLVTLGAVRTTTTPRTLRWQLWDRTNALAPQVLLHGYLTIRQAFGAS